MAKRQIIDYSLVKSVIKGASLSEQIQIQSEEEQVTDIAIQKLKENPFQPRIDMRYEKLEELANSIKENGLLQPITIVKKGDNYVIIYGHRRVQACLLLGKKTIKAIVLQKVEHAQLAILPLVENIQRENMNPVETAISMKRIIDEKVVNSQNELADHLGLTKSWVSKILSVIKLPDDVLKAIKTDGYSDVTVLTTLNKLSQNHLEIYNNVKDLSRQAALKYIKTINGYPPKTVLKRIVWEKNKVSINLKGLPIETVEDVKKHIKKLEMILGE